MRSSLNFIAVELVALGVLAVAVVAYGHLGVDLSVAPFEDAAMLMRYATHLAAGQGFVWNVGEAPVDGATDVGLTLVVAGLIRAGLSVETATRALGLAAHSLTVLLLYVTLRRLWRAPLGASLLSALAFAVGPGLPLIAAYFGTPLFALLSAATWTLGLFVVTRGETWFRAGAFAVLALSMGLVRPEGAILGVLMALAVLLIAGPGRCRRTMLAFVLAFGLGGGAYFLWHWSTFGFPLPNPFYKKGGGHLYGDSLLNSARNVVIQAGPFLLAYPLGLLDAGFRRRLRYVAGLLLPVVGFAAAFVLISKEMNFDGRFQYALLPVILLSWYPLAQGAWHWLSPPPLQTLDRPGVAGAVTFVALFSAFVLGCAIMGGRQVYHHDGRVAVGRMLSDYQDKGYTLATSEAGLLPLYSRWRTVDTWGLNDPWIAHHGGVTEGYLDQNRPELLVFHAYFSPRSPQEDREGAWTDMVTLLSRWAQERGYVLAACFGDSPHDTHWYYVRPDFPDAEAIVRRIRETPYTWQPTGRQAVDYRLTSE
jgi:arabinofuranosyltransferase